MKYTPDEILAIFQEQHRLCSPLDPIAMETYELNEKTLIWEWRDAQDLLPWENLSEFLNYEFNISASRKEWKTVFEPDDKRTLWDICDFISKRAEKLTFEPVKVLGRKCFEAGVFYKIKSELSKKGVNTDQLRPSTELADFLKEDSNFSPLVEIITLTGIKTIDQFELGENEMVKRKKYWIDKFITRLMTKKPLLTGDVATFKDLINRIVEGRKLSTTY